MTDRHINFRYYQVRAALENRLSQTRRVLKPQPQGIAKAERVASSFWTLTPEGNRCAVDFKAPPHAPGDRLWVREAFATGFDIDDEMGRPIGDRKAWYRATDARLTWYDPDTESTLDNPPWKPSIHMPRWASRLTLTVTDVRVQRLQDISEADAVAEGWRGPVTDIGYPISKPLQWFADIWINLHGPDAWAANPWVCAMTFTVQRGNIDQIGGGNG